MPVTREPRPGRRRRLRLAVIVLALTTGAALVARIAWQAAEARREQAQSVQASALFAERCRTAGEERPGVGAVGGADALVWMPRPLRLAGGRASDRVRADDAFDRGCSFDQCIAGLLRVSFGAASDPVEAAERAEGFRTVEAFDPRDLARYRYQAGIGVVRWLTAAEIDFAYAATGEQPGPAVYGLVVQREEIDAFGAPHAIAWDDISTDEDRAHGIAGSALTVLDLRTGDVIGRRVGFTIGAGQDGRAASGGSAGRSRVVQSCPQEPGTPRPGTADRDFALSLLR